MLMKKFLTIISLMVFLGTLAQQNADKIFWKENALTWEDFRAEPDENSTFQANTSAGLSYSWGTRNENGLVSLNYEVLSYFNPGNSWVFPESRGSEYLLSHEQLHFDITELHARKLRKKLSEINSGDLGKDPRKVLNRLYENIEKERAAMQFQYDKETNHSINREAQRHWQEYVKREIKKYENYNT